MCQRGGRDCDVGGHLYKCHIRQSFQLLALLLSLLRPYAKAYSLSNFFLHLSVLLPLYTLYSWLITFHFPHLSVGRSLWYCANRRDRCVSVGGGQGHCGQGRSARLALLPLVRHESRQRVELFLTLPTQEHVFVVCRKAKKTKQKSREKDTGVNSGFS